MENEHGHSSEEVAKRLVQNQQTNSLKDLIYGGIDGAITTFAIVAGVEGAGLSHGVIVALGFANILADGFSMAASNYSGTKAELDDRKRIIEVEKRHIANNPDGEMEELRQILARWGLKGTMAREVAVAISQDKETWIDIMLTEEYGLPRAMPSAMKAALSTFGAFLVCGMIPLLPFVLGVPNAFPIAIAVTLLTFFLIGTGKSRWSLSSWWKSGVETLSIGAVAALIAFFVGGLFNNG